VLGFGRKSADDEGPRPCPGLPPVPRCGVWPDRGPPPPLRIEAAAPPGRGAACAGAGPEPGPAVAAGAGNVAGAAWGGMGGAVAAGRAVEPAGIVPTAAVWVGEGSTVGAGVWGVGRDGGALGATALSATAAWEAAGADELAPGRWAVEAVGLIGSVSAGLGRDGGDDDSFAGAAA
jgi:hypothetical protein